MPHTVASIPRHIQILVPEYPVVTSSSTQNLEEPSCCSVPNDFHSRLQGPGPLGPGCSTPRGPRGPQARQAAQEAGCSCTQVAAHIRNLRAGLERRGCGRPPSLTDSEDNALVAYVLKLVKTSSILGVYQAFIVNACDRLRGARTGP